MANVNYLLSDVVACKIWNVAACYSVGPKLVKVLYSILCWTEHPKLHRQLFIIILVYISDVLVKQNVNMHNIQYDN